MSGARWARRGRVSQAVLCLAALAPIASAVGAHVAQAIAGTPADGAVAQPADTSRQVQSPQRLSEWLLASPPPPGTDLLGLSWRSQGEVAAQVQARDALLRAIKDRFPGLAGVLADMPATGRVPLPQADVRWLQANPVADPVLKPGDTVALPSRRQTVVVLKATGHQCRVPHRADAAVVTYLQACDGGHADRAWVVQPDGAVLEMDVARWNEGPQVAPAPGAWIWAPQRDEGFPAGWSAPLARFLATQGPSPAQATWSYRRELPPAGVGLAQAGQAHSLPLVANDWGMTGLLQTPTARMGPAGGAALTFSRVQPYGALHARLQPLDWLEIGFGYISISDRRYGPESLSGGQSFKDKSAHVKVRLLKESDRWPQVAVGWRDLLGTGIFSGEYLVASKRWGDWDFSLGLGFGYVGARGDLRNPLGLLSDRFDERPGAGSDQGGSVNARSFFRGRTALFGGVQYQTPWAPWLVKLEVDGNDYRHDQAGRPIRQASPVNVALVYRPTSWLDVTLGVERGRTAMLAVSAHTQLDGLGMPKFLDPRPPAVSPSRPAAAGDTARTAREIQALTGAQVSSIHAQGNTWTVTLADAQLGHQRPLVDKAVAVAHRDAPAEVDRIELRFDYRGVGVAQASVDRTAWVRSQTELVPPAERAPEVANGAPPAAAPGQAVFQSAPDRWSHGAALNYRQNLGGPDAFLLFQLALDLQAEWRPRPDTWVAGTLRLGLLDNYDKFKYTAPSLLPRVRTYIREYLVTSRATVPNLQLSHLGRAGQDHFYLAYAGLLEPMFAGVGGEYLWRPVDSRWAFGLDLNRVRQRDFEQRLSMRDYEVTTGHATAYWDTGWSDVLVKASVGQYLAGDKGVTLDISRVFGNGVTMGAYATKTDVSAREFGEGSFDKGVYITIPFDAMLPRSGPSAVNITYAPLIRDGGARLNRRVELFDLTRLRGPRALSTR